MLGVALGLGGAFGLTRLLEGFLFQVKAFDPLRFAGVAAALIVVSLAACGYRRGAQHKWTRLSRSGANSAQL